MLAVTVEVDDCCIYKLSYHYGIINSYDLMKQCYYVMCIWKQTLNYLCSRRGTEQWTMWYIYVYISKQHVTEPKLSMLILRRFQNFHSHVHGKSIQWPAYDANSEEYLHFRKEMYQLTLMQSTPKAAPCVLSYTIWTK